MQRRSGKKLRTRSPTLTALTVFFLTLISISLASLLFYSLMMNTARTEFKQMAQIVSNATISSEKDQLLDVYAEFHKQNSDFVGWISLEGTSLDYPIMQTIDAPEYYLRRDFNKNYSLAGTPFLDARSDMENGNSLIVYGHNMNDGSMFAVLQNYLKEGFLEQHPAFECDSLLQKRHFQIFAVLHFKDSPENDSSYYAFPLDETSFSRCVERIQADALYETPSIVTWGDQLLLLSTCDQNDAESRILIACYREKQDL